MVSPSLPISARSSLPTRGLPHSVVVFHLAENKRDRKYPFTFMATVIDAVDATEPLHRRPSCLALSDLDSARVIPGEELAEIS